MLLNQSEGRPAVLNPSFLCSVKRAVAFLLSIALTLSSFGSSAAIYHCLTGMAAGNAKEPTCHHAKPPVKDCCQLQVSACNLGPYENATAYQQHKPRPAQEAELSAYTTYAPVVASASPVAWIPSDPEPFHKENLHLLNRTLLI